MKRFFALVLVLALCLTSLSLTASAADPQIVLASVEGQPGEQVTIDLSISGNTGLAYLKLKVGYDSSALTLVKAENAGLLGGTYTNSQTIDVNPYVLQWMAAGNTVGDGVIARITFTISETAPAGVQPITLSLSECYNEEFDDVEFALVPGTITVAKEAGSVEGISLNKESLSLKVNESETLIATITPEDAANQNVTWQSDNQAVAQVDAAGKVTAVAEGTATITVTTEDGGYTASCVVTVPHVHTYGSEWKYDETNHWHECVSGDGAKADEAAHSGGTATCQDLAVCEFCDAPYGDYADHVLVKTEAVEADHYNPGNIAYWTCSVCGKVFRDAAGTEEITMEDTVIPVIPHEYSDEWSFNEENHWHECGCGSIIDQEAHTFVWVTDVPATEETTGLKHEECTLCGYKRNENTEISKLPHELVHYDAKAATCAAEGNVEYWHCVNCGKNFGDEDATQVLDTIVTPINPDNHTGNTEIRDAAAATCTAEGYTGDTYCADCGEKLEDGTVITKLPHNLTYHDAVAATCAATGNVEYWHCETCGQNFGDADATQVLDTIVTPINPDNHTGNTEIRNAAAATCTAEGYTGDTYCADCGEKLEDGSVITKLPHNLTHHDAVAATCAATGNVEYWHCETCGQNFGDEDATQVLDTIVTPINPDNHTGNTEIRNAAAATCTEDGYTGDTYCADCGVLLETGTVIAATGHTIVKVDAVEPDHYHAGNIEHWACVEGDALFADPEGTEELTEQDVVIPVIPHEYSDEWSSDEEHHWHACGCGSIIDLADHTFGQWTVTKEATETEEGSRQRVCDVCGYVQIESLPVLTPVETEPEATVPETTAPETNAPETGTGETGDESPKTGDSGIMGACLIMVLSAVGLFSLVWIDKKKHGEI